MLDTRAKLKYNGDGDIELRRDGTFRVWVQNSQAVLTLNRRFKKYPEELDFVGEGMEGIFDFTGADLAFVEAVLKKFPNPPSKDPKGA